MKTATIRTYVEVVAVVGNIRKVEREGGDKIGVLRPLLCS